MPWTRKEVKFLFSSGSPLTGAQKDKMEGELHADPSLGHEKKGSKEMKRGKPAKKRLKRGEFKKGGYNWKDYGG